MFINFIVIVCLFILGPYTILTFLQSQYFIAAIDFTTFLSVLLGYIYYKKTKKYDFLIYLMIVSLGILFLTLMFNSGIDYSGPLWSYIFPASVMFMTGRKNGVKFSLLFLFITLIIFLLNPEGTSYSISFKIRYVGSFISVAIISYYIEYVRETMHHVLRKQNKDLLRSLKYVEQKEIELSEKELHYRTLFEASSDAIFLMNEETFTDCNPKTLEIFGCNREEIIGKSPIKFSPEFQSDGMLSSDKAMDKITKTLNGQPQFFEWMHCKLDGTPFYAEVSLNFIKLEGKKTIQATVRDISSRKHVEAELLVAKERAERSDRLKSDFLAQMSHEIRTPINTIMNYTALLKMEFEHIVSEDNSGSFKSIQNAAIRLLRTIDLILNISDLEAGTYDPNFELNDLIKDIINPVVSEFEQAAENKGISIKLLYNIDDSAPAIIDNYTVSQTIANLLDNAVKYTDVGEITIKLDKIGENFVLKIQDTGVGISKEYLPNLFDKFSQEEAGYTRRYEGNGLGLALVKKYCEVNSIDISVESIKGIGTTFTLKIPIK